MFSEEIITRLRDKLIHDGSYTLKDAYQLGVEHGEELSQQKYIIDSSNVTSIAIRESSSKELLITLWCDDRGLDRAVAQELANACVETLISKDK